MSKVCFCLIELLNPRRRKTHQDISKFLSTFDFRLLTLDFFYAPGSSRMTSDGFLSSRKPLKDG